MYNGNLAFQTAFAALALFITTSASAEQAPTALELASPFIDDAILQRQMPVPVWGWAEPGDTVTVEFADQKKSAKAGIDGKWTVWLDPLKASADPRTMTVKSSIGSRAKRDGHTEGGQRSGNHQSSIGNVLVGEVWLSSGQSNMDWIAGKSMCGSLAGSLAKASPEVPIREFHVAAGSSILPQERVQPSAGWKRAKHAGGFSALSLSFAHKLYEELGVPIGLLRSTHGATPIETWTPYVGFASHPNLQDIALQIRQADPSTPEGKVAYEQYYKDLRQWQLDSEAIMNRGGKALPRPKLPGIASDWKGAGRMFNKKINGLAPYAIRGMIWCQGANNAGDGRIYADKMEALAFGIRKVWERPTLPFYFTQMQAYGSVDADQVGYADLRQVQTLFFTRNMDKNIGMVVQHDMNSARPAGIHNFNKLHPGWRMARWALAHEYGRTDVAYTGPLYKSHTIEGGTVRVSFEQLGPGGKLMVGSKGMAKDYREAGKYLEPARPTPGEKLTHFRLAGVDGTWHAAEAVIEGMDVVVTSDDVPEPVGVQYAFSAVPMGANLYNEAGLPAISFAYFEGKRVFQEDLRARKPTTASAEKPARRPYVSVMTPFRNGALVQRDMPAPVWGFALPGEKVTVSFGDQAKTTVVDEFSRWRVTLDPMPANATGRDLVITTGNGLSRTIRKVVVGDLWFFSGTRSLDKPVVDARAKDAMAPPEMPLLREFRVRTKARKHHVAKKRRMETGGGRFLSRWVSAEAGDKGMDITAAAYHFAKEVRQEGVPIGIMNMGADNPPLTWISYEGLQTAEGFEPERDNINLACPNTDACQRALDRYIEELKAYCSEIQKLRTKGDAIPPELAERPPAFPQPSFSVWSQNTETATHTYNWLVSPNTPLAVKGVVWIPGRKNLGKDVSRYAAALEAYASSLPQTYGQRKVPFFYAQPSRELMALEATEGVDDIAIPKIDDAQCVRFEQWPKSPAELATTLGAAAARTQ